MKFGLSFLPDASPATKPAERYFAEALELAELAEHAGLSHVKMTEHYLHPYGGYCPSPLGFLAAVAARTRRIRLITGCVLPTFHHPLQTASEAAMVDALSAGRLEVGFARAYLPYEFAAFGIPMDESRERFQASIEAVIRLWTEERVSLKSRFFELREATILPRPTQLPHPPVWCAAVRTPESFEWVAQKGFELLISALFSPERTLGEHVSRYRARFRERQGERRPRVAISLPLFVAPTEAAAREESERYLARYLSVWGDAASAWNDASSPDYATYSGMGEAFRQCSPERMRREGSAIVGDPAHVLEQVQRLRDSLGVTDVLWQIDFGAMPGELARRSLELFARDVLPRV